MRCWCVSASTSRTDIEGGIVIGSFTTPLSKRLTLATSAAWRAGDMFLCTTPSPPSCAMAMASRASVTVSIAAETTGMLSAMLRVRRVLKRDVAGNDLRMRGDEQDVVESQRFADDTHRQFSPGAKINYTRVTPTSQARVLYLPRVRARTHMRNQGVIDGR